MYYADVPHTWISTPTPRHDAQWRLICFPHAGGGASSFHGWSAALADASVEVAALRLPGREARVNEPAIVELRSLVAQLDEALHGWSDGRPEVWFGHSSGARVAFELARRRRATGRRLPDQLVVSGAPAPDVPRAMSTLHTITDDQAFLAAVSCAYGGVPPTVLEHPELLSLVTPALRADLRMHERYVYVEAPPLPIPILAVGGADDRSVPEAWLRRWGRQTTSTFDVALLPGDHFYLQAPPARDLLLRLLVERAPPQPPGPEPTRSSQP